MDLDRFLAKYATPLDRAQARRDLAEVLAHLDESDAHELARREGYRSALEEAQNALRAHVTAERFGWWLRDRLAEIRAEER